MAGKRPIVRGSRGDVVLFDEHEQPFNASATVTAWRGGNSDARRALSWATTDAAINALLAGEVSELRRRTRDVRRKIPWAESGAASFTANCIGNGIVPRPLTDDDDLRRELMEAWDDWVEQADADGTCDFYGLQALICNSYREAGDCFVRLRSRDPRDMARTGLCMSLQLQVLEAELVDPTYEEVTFAGANRIQAGIEFDGIGRRVAYHMWREHPGDMVTRRNFERVAVPAQNVLHVYEVQRPGQIRGVPAAASALATIYELGKYDDAELMRKQIAAMFAGFVIKPDRNSNPLDAGITGTDAADRPLVTLQPGMMQELEPGQDIRFSNPADVGNSYESFQHTQLRQIAAAYGITYEQLTGDWSEVNYSSARAALIEIRRRMDQRRRNTIIFQLCRPVWRRFVESAVLCGRVALPSDPAKLRDLTRVAWTVTPGEAFVDPEKEVRAIVARIRAGLISRSKATAEHGFDAEALDREIAADNARADALGLRFSGDGRYPENGGGGAQPPGARPGAERNPFGGAPVVDDEAEGEDEAAALAVLRGLRSLRDRGLLEAR